MVGGSDPTWSGHGPDALGLGHRGVDRGGIAAGPGDRGKIGDGARGEANEADRVAQPRDGRQLVNAGQGCLERLPSGRRPTEPVRRRPPGTAR